MITVETLLARNEVQVRVNQLVDRLYQLGEELDFSNLMDEESDGCKEIYEFWLVSEWLAEKIEEAGGCVTEYLDLYIWGRTETGQSLTLDNTLNEVCKRVNAS